MRRSNVPYRISNFAIFTISLLFILAASTNVYSQVSDNIKKQFEQAISKLSGVTVSIGEYKLDYGTISLQNIQVGSREEPHQPYAKIEKISATCDFMSLLGGNLVLNNISISSMTCELTTNLGDRFHKSSKPPLEKTKASEQKKIVAELPFLKLKGSNLTLIIIDKKTGKTFISNLNFASLEKTKDSEELSIDFSGSISAFNSLKPKTQIISSGLSGKMLLSGEVQEPKLLGKITIEKTIVTEKLLKQDLKIDKTRFEFIGSAIKTDKSSGTWGNSKFEVSGQVNDFHKYNLSLEYKIHPLSLNELSSAFITNKGVAVTGSGEATGKVSGSFEDLSVNGDFAFPQCKVSFPIGTSGKDKYIFPFTNLSGNYKYADKKIDVLKSKANIFGGTINGFGKIFPWKDPVKFEFDAVGSGLRAEQFLSENTSQNKALSGAIHAKFNAFGDSRGLISLNGNGNFNLKNGYYKAPPVVTPVLSLVNLNEFSSGDINSGKGSFILSNGILNTEDLVFVSDAGKAYYRGKVGLDTSLSGKMNIIFAREAVAKSQALKQISLNGKTADLPTRVEGTLLSPSFPGFSPQKLLELGLKRKGQKMLQDLLFKGKDSSSNNEKSNDDNKQDSGKKILNDLKKIFKF